MNSRNRRPVIFLIGFLIVLLILAVIGLFVLQAVSNEDTTTSDDSSQNQDSQTAEATQPPMLNIVIAARDIPRGARLSVEDVTILNWPDLPDAPPPPGAMILNGDADSEGLEQVENRIARVDILNGQPILEHMLTPGS